MLCSQLPMKLVEHHFRSRYNDQKFMFAGKTGSSQIKRFTELQRELEIKQKDIVYKDRDHALFVAFAPYSDPKYAISVVVEHGGNRKWFSSSYCKNNQKSF